MKIRIVLPLAAAAIVALSALANAQSTRPAAVTAIDTDCSAIHDAVMALKPVHLALVKSTWQVLSDADYAVAEKTTSSVTLVDAWNQGGNYAWIHAHSFDAKGNQTATQLCFRQADGSLERARQAKTVDDFDAASAQQAYFTSDGTLIQKTELFEVNDPAIAKKVSDLPFYKQLP